MTIESSLNQSYRPIEVIVVDNSSTDNTSEEVSRRFCGRVHYVRQPNRGDAGAYNTGFSMASGEFIQFIDGDDVLSPTKIEKQMEIFSKDPAADIVYGDARMFQTLAGPANWIDPATREENDIWNSLISSHVGISALGTLWHRRSLEKTGLWDETLYVADLDYFLRAAWAGCKYVHCPGGPMGFARVRPGQMNSDTNAISRGLESVWHKALGYVTREPYRSMIAAELARIRYMMALSRNIPRKDAIQFLALARETNSETVSKPVYAMTYAGILVPALRISFLRKFRRAILRQFLAVTSEK